MDLSNLPAQRNAPATTFVEFRSSLIIGSDPTLITLWSSLQNESNHRKKKSVI